MFLKLSFYITLGVYVLLYAYPVLYYISFDSSHFLVLDYCVLSRYDFGIPQWDWRIKLDQPVIPLLVALGRNQEV